jgi:hypothetical protein
MTEPTSDTPPTAIYAQPWAVRLGAVVLAAFTLILGMAFFDSAHRGELETVAETTAVGDSAYLALPTEVRLPAVGANLNGKALYVAGVQTIVVRDTHTRRVGRDAERKLSIYELAASATELERQQVGAGPAFLLKAGENEYLLAK